MEYHPPYNTLKASRVQRGLNQDNIAKAIGIAPSTYCRKENGDSDFTVTETKKVAAILNENPLNLFYCDQQHI